MPSLYEQLQTIMDMTNPWNEACKKLQETWMVVNGTPKRIRTFIEETSDLAVVYVTGGRETIEVKTLEIFLPESGLYMQSNGFPCVVVKLPKRQWLKSYHDSFYSVKGVGGGLAKTFLDDIHKNPRQDILMDKKGNVYYWESVIGKREKNGSITCLDLNFSQELIDWRKHNANIHA